MNQQQDWYYDELGGESKSLGNVYDMGQDLNSPICKLPTPPAPTSKTPPLGCDWVCSDLDGASYVQTPQLKAWRTQHPPTSMASASATQPSFLGREPDSFGVACWDDMVLPKSKGPSAFSPYKSNRTTQSDSTLFEDPANVGHSTPMKSKRTSSKVSSGDSYVVGSDKSCGSASVSWNDVGGGAPKPKHDYSACGSSYTPAKPKSSTTKSSIPVLNYSRYSSHYTGIVEQISDCGKSYLSISDVFSHVTMGGMLSEESFKDLAKAVNQYLDLNYSRKKYVNVTRYYGPLRLPNRFKMVHYTLSDYTMIARACLDWYDSNLDKVVYC